VTEQATKAFIAVGSNIDPQHNIIQALQRLQNHVAITGISTFYQTPPIDRPDQPPFLNGIWRIETTIPPRPLKFKYLRAIETDLDRVRTADKYTSRTIDLDIVLYGDQVIDEPDLKIPDPDIRSRPFITIPLLELEPELILPDNKEQLATILKKPNAQGMTPATRFTQHLKSLI